MKRDERQQADALDQYLNDLRAGKQVTPPTPEAETAAELMTLLTQIRPTPKTGSPSSLSDELKEPRPMTATRNPSATDWMLPLVAALLMMAFVLILVMKPQQNLPLLAPPQQEDVKRLPIPVGGVVGELDTAAIEWMHAAGMEWVAYDLIYERANNAEALEQISKLIEDAHAQNFKVLLSIGGAAAEMEADDAVAAYAEFVGQAAGLGADAVVVWREPNLDRDWPQDKLDPVNYVALLSASYTAIKAVNAETLVISAAPAPTEAESLFPGQIVNDDVYYQGMAEAGAAEFADCIGVEYVEGILPPTVTTGDSRDNAGTDVATRYLVPNLQRAGAAFRESGLPFCVTGFGYLTPEGLDHPLSRPFQWANNTTVEQQAEWLASGIQTMAQLSSIRIQMVIVYHVNDITHPDSAGFAILRPDGTCPACNAIAELREY